MAKKSVKQASAAIVKTVKAKAEAAGASAAAASVMAQTVKKAFEKEIDKKGLKVGGPSAAQLASREKFAAMARAGKSRGAMSAMKVKTASGFTAKQLAAQRKFVAMARKNAKKPTAKQKAARKAFAANAKGFARDRAAHLRKLRANPKRREAPLKVLIARQVKLTKLIRSRKSE